MAIFSLHLRRVLLFNTIFVLVLFLFLTFIDVGFSRFLAKKLGFGLDSVVLMKAL